VTSQKADPKKIVPKKVVTRMTIIKIALHLNLLLLKLFEAFNQRDSEGGGAVI